MTPNFTVLYSCAACGAVDRRVEVRARERDESVALWMRNVVTPALGSDHATRGCSSRSCDLKIPVPEGADWIGQAVKQ